MTKQVRILIVDDEPQNIRFITGALKDKNFRLQAVTSGKKALEVARKTLPDLILLDIMMPAMDGYEVCRRLKADDGTRQIPLIFISAMDEIDSKAKGFELGAVDYITKPIEPVEVLARVLIHLELKRHRDDLAGLVAERTRELEESQQEIVIRLGLAAEFRDEDTGNHIHRMQSYCRLLGQALAFPEADLEMLVMASPMHDVGKIGIPDHILLKPGKLDTEEFDIMKTHTTIGERILSGGRSRLIRLARVIALTHHEKWDGSGYPKGLRGDDIPLVGQVVALADVYDALTSQRVYKPAFSHEKAKAIIQEGADRHFSPIMTALFLELADAFRLVALKYRDEPV